MSEAGRFGTFIVTGGIAAGVNVVARWLFEFVMPFEAAVTLAYGCGMVTAFVLARHFVFTEAGGDTRGQFLRFAVVNAVAFAQVLLVSVLLERFIFPAIGFTWFADTVAHIVGVISPVVASYVLHKQFSFRQAAGDAR